MLKVRKRPGMEKEDVLKADGDSSDDDDEGGTGVWGKIFGSPDKKKAPAPAAVAPSEESQVRAGAALTARHLPAADLSPRVPATRLLSLPPMRPPHSFCQPFAPPCPLRVRTSSMSLLWPQATCTRGCRRSCSSA